MYNGVEVFALFSRKTNSQAPRAAAAIYTLSYLVPGKTTWSEV